MTEPLHHGLIDAILASGGRAVDVAETHDLTDPEHRLQLFEVVLHVIAAGSAARDAQLADSALSRLVQARDKLTHMYRVEDILPSYVASLVETRVRPAVERAKALRDEAE